MAVLTRAVTCGWARHPLAPHRVTDPWTDPKRAWKEEEAVTPCTRDYVATNGWLSKGRNRLTSGTARNPCFKRLKTHAQRALNAKNGRNRSERDERATPAELPPSVENAAERKGTLKAQAGKQCWHHFLFFFFFLAWKALRKKKRVRYKETPRGPANPMFAPGPNPCPALVTQSATNLL
jgi:hypothetical protein